MDDAIIEVDKKLALEDDHPSSSLETHPSVTLDPPHYLGFSVHCGSSSI